MHASVSSSWFTWDRGKQQLKASFFEDFPALTVVSEVEALSRVGADWRRHSQCEESIEVRLTLLMEREAFQIADVFMLQYLLF